MVSNGYGSRLEVRGHSLAAHAQLLLHCSFPPRLVFSTCSSGRSGGAGRGGAQRKPLVPLTRSSLSH